MNPSQLPGAKVIAPVLWAILIFGAGLWASKFIWRGGNLGASMDERVTLSVLRSEALTFLVTRRMSTQVVIDHSQSDWAGEWRGVLWCTVSLRWGVDLNKITAADIRRDGDVIVVRIPDPELLDFSLVPGSTGFISKATAVPKVMDLARGGWLRQSLESKLPDRAMKFAQDANLLPNRAEILAQLNGASTLLRETAHLNLRFE